MIFLEISLKESSSIFEIFQKKARQKLFLEASDRDSIIIVPPPPPSTNVLFGLYSGHIPKFQGITPILNIHKEILVIL